MEIQAVVRFALLSTLAATVVSAQSTMPPPASLPSSSPRVVSAQEQYAIQPYDSEGRPNPDAFEWTGFALGLKIGTLGFGADATVYLSDWVNFRASGSLLPFNYKDTIDDIRFDLDMDFKGAMLLLDFYPFDGGNFRVTAGVAFSDNLLTLNATPAGPETIGDNEYTAEQIGTIKGDLDFKPVAPYIGIGYGNAVLPDASLTFAVDFGVMLQSYNATITSTGSAANDPGFQSDLAQLEKDIEDDLNRFKIYPVISFGIAYHF